jgi:DNA polymerase III delta prime subunit
MNSFDFCYCSLGYGVLMQTMHHSLFSEGLSGKTNACAILIRGPKGVGKRSLSRILAHQLLTGYPWLSCSASSHSIDPWSLPGSDINRLSVDRDGADESIGLDTSGSRSLKNGAQNTSALPNHWKHVALAWEKDHKKLDSHPEYLVLASGSGIDDIRKLRQQLSYTRFGDSLRVVVLPEVQSLGLSSMNALLKWIENPGPQTVFILTASGALPETVRSRCTEYTMPALDWEDFFRVRSCIQASEDGGLHAMDGAGSDQDHLDPRAQKYLFNISQGALVRAQYWQEHLPWVMQTWSVLYRCATESPVVDPEWLSTALGLGGAVWDVFYIWARDVGHVAYGQGFLHHWDYFWHDTWDLMVQHQIYHTEQSSVIQTVAARIHGFFTYYGARPMQEPL